MKNILIVGSMALVLTGTAQAEIPTRAYFGDTHLHTAFSPDAGLAGTSVGPEDAYRFAMGETIIGYLLLSILTLLLMMLRIMRMTTIFRLRKDGI